MCAKFGWTYDEYLDQPRWFLDIITTKMNAEARLARSKAKEIERLNRNQR